MESEEVTNNIRQQLLRFLAVLVLFAPVQLVAETPEEFSQRYLQELRTKGLSGVTGFIHPDEAKKLGDMLIELADIAEKAGQKVPFFGPDDTSAALRRLPPEKLCVKFFSFVEKAAPQLTQMLSGAQAKTIGHVTDGDTVYVVAKLTFETEGESIAATDVMPLKKDGDSYKVLLKAEVTNLLRAMKKQLAAK